MGGVWKDHVLKKLKLDKLYINQDRVMLKLICKISSLNLGPF